jgi:hypothetical protein
MQQECLGIIQIILHRTLLRFNGLQTIIGIFLQTVRAPKDTFELLTHMGLSISVSSTLSALQSLKREPEADVNPTAEEASVINYDTLDFSFAVAEATHSNQTTSLHAATAPLLPCPPPLTHQIFQCTK